MCHVHLGFNFFLNLFILSAIVASSTSASLRMLHSGSSSVPVCRKRGREESSVTFPCSRFQPQYSIPSVCCSKKQDASRRYCGSQRRIARLPTLYHVTGESHGLLTSPPSFYRVGTSRYRDRMAEAGSGSQNSSGSSSGDPTVKKKKAATKVVKSRYMQYKKPDNVKKQNLEVSVLGAPGKVPDRGGSNTPTRRSVMPQRSKAPSAVPTIADGSICWKEDLQSTLLDGHKIARPELDFSVINDKTIQKLTPKSSSSTSSLTSEPKKPKRETAPITCVPADLIEMYESQTLLFTYLTIKMQKNMKRLEDKAQRSLLLANEEKNRLQEKVYQLKCNQLVARKEAQLGDLLEKQAEGLVPSSASINQFKDKYTSFATAVDCTRHHLPINNLHVVGTQQRYLESLQKHLNSTKSLLGETIPHSSDGSIDLLATITKLEDIALKTDTELSRSLNQILDLSSKVNKEMSLQSQKSVEEHCEVDLLKQWYFDQAID